MIFAGPAAAFAIATTLIQAATVAVTAMRCRARPAAAGAAELPPVSIIRPACGVETFSEETLGSAFRLDYPDYEVIFCLARADDPVAPLIRRLIAAHPQVPARLLIGEERVNANLKLNNFVKGWDAARHDWVVSADSNVLMPPDCVQRMMVRWLPGTGLVCSVPIGSRPVGFWAALECAFLNSYQARWQYIPESLKQGFAQGKTMLMNRRVIEDGGGIRALGAVIAEDAAATMLVRRAGLRVRLVDQAFEQPLGRRSAREVLARQMRWAKLRRATFPLVYLPEAIAGCVLPVAAGAYASAALGGNVALTVALLLIIWIGAEAALAWALGWFVAPALLPAILLRDLLLPFLWIKSWLDSDYEWRGTKVSGQAILAVEEKPL